MLCSLWSYWFIRCINFLCLYCVVVVSQHLFQLWHLGPLLAWLSAEVACRECWLSIGRVGTALLWRAMPGKGWWLFHILRNILSSLSVIVNPWIEPPDVPSALDLMMNQLKCSSTTADDKTSIRSNHHLRQHPTISALLRGALMVFPFTLHHPSILQLSTLNFFCFFFCTGDIVCHRAAIFQREVFFLPLMYSASMAN